MTSQPSVYIALSQFCDGSDAPRLALQDSGFVVKVNQHGRRLKSSEIVAEAVDADAIVAGVESYDRAVIEGLPRLRCISRCGVGTDSIDMEAARGRGIRVFNTPDEVVEPVAQLVLGMVLALARNFPQAISDSREKQWRRRTGFLLSEWTIGIIGFGRIGRAVAEYLRPFRSRILICDPYVSPAEVGDKGTVCDLQTLLSSADLVSLHAVKNAAEGPILGRAEIASMKRGSRLINTARGYLVDESALIDALTAGHLAGAALDVFESEPYSGPLAALPQVLCTPHVGSLTNASRQAMEMRAVRNVIEFHFPL